MVMQPLQDPGRGHAMRPRYVDHDTAELVQEPSRQPRIVKMSGSEPIRPARVQVRSDLLEQRRDIRVGTGMHRVTQLKKMLPAVDEIDDRTPFRRLQELV